MNIKNALRTLKFGDKLQTAKHQLTTKWGDELDPDYVLTEYPRPQLRRSNYTILNGYWNYVITKETVKPKEFDGIILVPFSPESALSGVNRQVKPGEFLWYERAVTIVDKQPGMRCILHFGAVDQSSEVYCNHTLVARHGGGYLPFSIDITKEIRKGDNSLMLKVTDPSNTSYHSRGKQRLVNGGMWYTAQSGIWQTVWYEWVPERYITGVKITPNVEKSEVNLLISMNSFNLEPPQEPQYQVSVIENGKILQTVLAYQDSITIKLSDFIYWSPEDPYLYGLEIIAGQDRIESYFAMRSVEIKEAEDGRLRVYLNGEPYFQNGLLDQGYWPDGLYTAPSDEAMIFDIEQAKRLGFNMLRKHIKIEPLRWYYHCDRLGMLVWQDMVNGGEEYHMLLVSYLPTIFPGIAGIIKDKYYALFGRANAEGRREWSAECRETVELLYNSPCIVCWVPFNEGWGQFDASEAYRLIKELDATRLIDHASGWYDQGIGDFESIHNYFHPLKVHYKKRPVIFSEIGGYACYIEKHSYSPRVYGYRVYSTKEELNEAYQSLYREKLASLRKEGLSAVVYTQLTDVEEEVNGLLTYDRKLCKVEPLSIPDTDQ